MEEASLEFAKKRFLDIASKYSDRLRRARRVFVEERSVALKDDREIEYLIKEEVSQFFGVSYPEVAFTGSAQMGFSAYKNRPFVKAVSDLDVACVSAELFQRAWADVVTTTRAFTDDTKFSGMSPSEVDLFKMGILKRGMIRVSIMPRSDLASRWKSFEDAISRKYSSHFGKIGFAVYLSEYAFCWKQDSVFSHLMKGP